MVETLEDNHTRARRILVQTCEDFMVNGQERTMSKSESQWVMTVVSRFTRGLRRSWLSFRSVKQSLHAIVHFSVKYHHHFTTAHTAIFFTDHKPLVTFINSDRHVGIYARWAAKLQERNFRFEHIVGRRNVIANGLSRTMFPGEDPGWSRG